MNSMFEIMIIGVVAAGVLVLAMAIRFAACRGKRIVICPETEKPVAAEVDALHAARTGLTGAPHFVISRCSRWPERAGCDQACAPQIAASPRETLVKDIVERWYRGRACVYCGKSICDISGALAPALRTFDGSLREWNTIQPEQLPDLLQTAMAVCASCELAESFRRDFPELVIDRPRESPSAERHRMPCSEAVY